MLRITQSEIGAGPDLFFPFVLLHTHEINAFRRRIYAYFRRHGRDLPWRHTRDPYCVMVAEIMLQQTQVDRVAAKYPAFVRRFPGFAALAAAPVREVLQQWLGLGYNRRALSLKKAAEMVMRDFGGRLPRSVEELKSLPGIGAATARSILVYAFNRPEVFIETNIRAVYIHHFFTGRAEVGDEEILPLVGQTLDRRDPWRWYSALMDYGSALKKQHANPARRSRHHTRQSPFVGSDRQIRGKIVRALLAPRAVALRTLIAAAGGDPARVRRIVSAMVKEGLVRHAGPGRFTTPQ